jgi:gluconolactonase
VTQASLPSVALVVAVACGVACGGDGAAGHPPRNAKAAAPRLGNGAADTAAAGVARRRWSVCPVDSASLPVTVPESAGSPIAGVPPPGGNPDNLEGPVWLDGWLYLSEIARRGSDPTQPQGGRILRMQPGQPAEVFLEDVGTNGLAVSPEGDLVAASHRLGAIVSFDRRTKPPSPTPKKTYAATFDGKRFSSPNDLAFRGDGAVYFTDPAYQAGSIKQAEERAYWVTPDGKLSIIPDTGAPPNGIILSPDEQTLYVGGAKLSAYALDADGSPGPRRAFPSEQSQLSGTDGLGVDCAGNLYVTLYAQGVVKVLTPSGDELGTIQVGAGVTNVAFGGVDGKTLYITRMTPPSLYAVPSRIPGLPY